MGAGCTKRGPPDRSTSSGLEAGQDNDGGRGGGEVPVTGLGGQVEGGRRRYRRRKRRRRRKTPGPGPELESGDGRSGNLGLRGAIAPLPPLSVPAAAVHGRSSRRRLSSARGGDSGSGTSGTLLTPRTPGTPGTPGTPSTPGGVALAALNPTAADQAVAVGSAVPSSGLVSEARAEITSAVAALRLPRSTSQIAVFGPNAAVVVAGRAATAGPRTEVPAPVVVASSIERGRVVALGHVNMLHPTVFTDERADGPVFVANVLRWLAGPCPSMPIVRAVGLARGYIDSLAALGPLLDLVVAPHLAVRELEALSPQDATVLVVLGGWRGFADPRGLCALQRYVKLGGAVLLLYDQKIEGAAEAAHGPVPSAAARHAFKTPRYPANDFTTPMGFVFTHQPVITSGDLREGPSNRLLALAHSSPEYGHVGAALDALNFLLEERSSRAKLPSVLVDVIDYYAVYLPLEASLFPPALCAAVWEAVPRILPSLDAPVYKKDIVQRLAVLVGSYEASNESGGVPAAAASAPVFPGPVPPTAKPQPRAVEIHINGPGWYSTGLYAPPGGLVAVALASASGTFGPDSPLAVDELPQVLLRIGAHSDVLFHAPEWRRHPSICCTAAIGLAGEQTVLHNPYGGLIYLEIREQAGGSPAAGSADLASRMVLDLEGTVLAPYYQHGTTSISEWRAMQLHRPAPWGELASSRIIFTLPTAVLREVEDPSAVLAFWDRVIDTMDVLSQRHGREGALVGSRARDGSSSAPAASQAWGAPSRRRPERVVGDVQLASGTLHNGYPIACSLPSLMFDAMDVRKLQSQGAWALFKCLGYNFQASNVLAFDGMADVAVNLFSLFVFDSMLGVSPLSHPRLNSREAAVMDFLFRGFDDPDLEPLWQRDPLAGAHMYVQLVVEFGWELFFGVFDSYAKAPLSVADVAANPPALLRDQWIVRLSQVAKHDLVPFFKLWGVRASKEATIATSQFPEWLPPYLGVSSMLSTKVTQLARRRH
ncbi:uncharacterized protein AMSG_02054 [Thecamonas trahens ATCC 50062]|uniref:Peptidase M60 domain-containing protein n=1 Tax=Thecamonas trahens ATCC 50062 TaxID=461836 RepID=A0A0L0DV19_THETB|nr:hypothetical protein AMSG_02054 [Thecamonas trahens ATCC 50062]KNC56042.1 hypothetical protein AMSG_02054 [Thecamonas trahens ATCC 50062]|eukprot:XP_013761086.1 hypothetical protein AMSG_02054 [Thecamonas trahens ATCC 50062]